MKSLLMVLALLLPGGAHAADENARRDTNRVPGLIGHDETTGETRRIKVTSAGFLVTVASNTVGGATLVDQGAAGSQDWLVVTNDSGSDTPFVSTHSVSGTAVEVMAADAARESSLICNEGPEPARVGPSATLISSIGQRLLVDQCVTFDGPAKPFRGALSAISTTGSPTKITAAEAS